MIFLTKLQNTFKEQTNENISTKYTMSNVLAPQYPMSYNILCPIAAYTLAFLLSVSFFSCLTFFHISAFEV